MGSYVAILAQLRTAESQKVAFEHGHLLAAFNVLKVGVQSVGAFEVLCIIRALGGHGCNLWLGC